MLEPEKPEDPNPGQPTPLKDEKAGLGQQRAPDESGLEPKDMPAKE